MARNPDATRLLMHRVHWAGEAARGVGFALPHGRLLPMVSGPVLLPGARPPRAAYVPLPEPEPEPAPMGFGWGEAWGLPRL